MDSAQYREKTEDVKFDLNWDRGPTGQMFIRGVSGTGMIESKNDVSVKKKSHPNNHFEWSQIAFFVSSSQSIRCYRETKANVLCNVVWSKIKRDNED